MLPKIIEWNFHRMRTEGKLSKREQAFFTDNRLIVFWKNVGEYLSDVKADYRNNAAAMLVGGFLNPINFGYGEAGTKEQPTRKTRIRAAQNKADPTIRRIALLAGELADALEELEDITSIHPGETRLLSIVYPLVDEDALRNLPSYYDGVRTYAALRILQNKFEEYPESGEIFKDVPGMASQKATWRDWMREAESNLNLTLEIYPGNLSLGEGDWLAIARILIGEHISRETMQDARRCCNTQPD